MGRSRSRTPQRRSPQRSRQCAECKKEFSSQTNLRRHIDEQHRRRERLKCPYCSQSFIRKHDLDRHWTAVHQRHEEQSQSTATAAELQVPRTPGRDLQDDMVSLEPGSVERRIVMSFQSLPPVHRVTGAPSTIAAPASTSNQVTSGRKTQKDASSQTEGGRTSRVVERTIKELLDGDGKISARVVVERFLTE